MKLVQMILLTCFFLMLSSCDKSSNSSMSSNVPNHSALANSPTSSVPAKKKINIALLLKTQTNPFFIEVEKGARRAEQELGIELTVKASAEETFIEEQIQLAEELIDAKVDAIVISPGDSQRLIPVLKKAQLAGVFIVNIDNMLDQKIMANQHMQAIPFISSDNEAASYEVIKFVTQKITNPTQFAIVEGMPGAVNAQLRTAGAKRALKENSALHLVAQETALWKINDAHEVAKHMLSQHSELRIIFCENDMMALGVAQYLSEIGRKDIQVIGYDALTEARAAIKAGRIVASVDQQAAEQGYQGVATALKVIKGESVPAIVIVKTQIITAATLN